MGKPRVSAEKLKKRETLAEEIKIFSEENKFTEIKLAESLGISRRSVQMAKAGRTGLNEKTILLFRVLQSRYRAEKKEI